jgi:radical SAM superfamily enzyme YgiQ (UPF0313 family)
MAVKSVLLIGFYNKKAMGVRYLEKSLKKQGYSVSIVFFKDFNSISPRAATAKELSLLIQVIQKIRPDLVGLSVMSSFYLETVYQVNDAIRDNFDVPIVWGGVFPSLFPEQCLEKADYVIRGEGEEALLELCNALNSSTPLDTVNNLCYRSGRNIKVNEMRLLCRELDSLGYPEPGGCNKYFIDMDSLAMGDPSIRSVSYELSASRGCPFSCSYCSSINLRRLYKDKGSYVRYRSVSSVIEELLQAKRVMKNLGVIHFWDEIFPVKLDWLQEFAREYKNKIGLPFQIWSHPLTTSSKIIGILKKAGLAKVVMGIQSGSPRVRKQIFHRDESQEDIIKASEILSACKIHDVVYDFILQHPFEEEEDMRQTFELCMQLKPPFKLQLHHLNFLPGTDITGIAIEKGIMTVEKLDSLMRAPMKEQYKCYWNGSKDNKVSNYWYALIFLTQFRLLKPVLRLLSCSSKSALLSTTARMAYKTMKPIGRIGHLFNKAMVMTSGKFRISRMQPLFGAKTLLL